MPPTIAPQELVVFPGNIAVGKLGAVMAGAGVPAISDAEVIKRHGAEPMHDGCGKNPRKLRH
jgi:hypothetical protein